MSGGSSLPSSRPDAGPAPGIAADNPSSSVDLKVDYVTRVLDTDSPIDSNEREHPIVQLTTRGRYAVTAMLDLAVHGGARPLRLADIAARQGISLSYLEQLFACLKRDGLVASVRGPGGGYRLGADLGEISVGAIIDSVNERIDVTRCGGRGDCQQGDTCLTHHLWTDLSEDLHQFLSSIRLADLLRAHQARVAGQSHSASAA